MTLVLHYAPDNASLIVRLALEELALPYRTVLVDRATRAQDGPAYRALNPVGLIPALETPGGVIFETAAILLWLAEQTGRLAPAPGSAGRGDFLKWMVFASNTVHAGLRMTFYPEKYVGADEAAQAALRAGVQARLTGDFALLDAAWRAGDPTMLDIYLAPLLRWSALYPEGGTAWFDLTRYPALHAMCTALEHRPCTLAAQTAEGLGPTPFTRPRHATPPEGSAT